MEQSRDTDAVLPVAPPYLAHVPPGRDVEYLASGGREGGASRTVLGEGRTGGFRGFGWGSVATIIRSTPLLTIAIRLRYFPVLT
eukprot:1403735-Rhodomonas_salina.1